MTTLDAWTREDDAALGWYAHQGFVERFRYLHVYAGAEEITTAVASRDGLTPVHAFLHAAIEDEQPMRSRFDRVYVCRQFVLALQPTRPTLPRSPDLGA